MNEDGVDLHLRYRVFQRTVASVWSIIYHNLLSLSTIQRH